MSASHRKALKHGTVADHALQPGSLVTTLLLGAASLCFLYPFAWMFLGSFKTNLEIFQPLQLWPERFDASYFKQLCGGEWFPFWRVYLNSALLSLSQATGAVFLTSLAGYGFTRYRWTERGVLFFLAVSVIVFPPPAMAIPLLTWLNRLCLIDQLAGVILPGVVSGLGIIYFTQVFRHLPGELVDMARVEGASEIRIYWTLLPLIRSSLVSFGVIHFILAWHQHLIPLLVLNSAENQTLPLALSALYGSSLRFPYAVLMAGSTLSILPAAILFGLCYRRFKSSLSELLIH